ncbi:VanZ family protein [Fimbriiglobus ruber]|uniref:VanZ-like domain-containing protein n=1 Tax=Fimbriiglobus ruber TaxID=1908690 RepID=A0A225DFQ6_9BACT|nr:VanZ family protein [Fimbriiglobus ruber]OWK35989.1 hypothetical protein FRUB_08552 [Fimbriiglobus ruber]
MTTTSTLPPARPPTAPGRPVSFRIRSFATALFAILLALWTWKLLEPNPVPEPVLGELRSVYDSLPFLLAKTLHMTGYAVLAALCVVWVPTRAGKWWAMGLLVAHGATTEFLQYYLDWGRTGRVTDVLIDTTGITIGALAAWRFWRRG